MKAHLRGKMLQLQLHKEDAVADPIAFAQKLQASCLSQVEKKTYDICKLRIFDVYPRIRYDVAMAPRSRFSQARVNGRVYRFPLRKVDAKRAARSSLQHRKTTASNQSAGESGATETVEDQGTKSANEASPNNSQSLDDDSLAARRPKRENAGKRGGVQSKYKFTEERIIGSTYCSSSLSRSKSSSATPTRPKSRNETIAETDDKSMVVEAPGW